MDAIAHKIGDDGWPDAIWQGVNEQRIILHLGRDHHKRTVGYVDVSTPEGKVRGYVGDWIVRNANAEFNIVSGNPPHVRTTG